MHAQQLGSLAILLATLVAAAPAPAPAPGFSLIPRSLSWTNQPSTEPICTNVNKDSPDTAAYSNDDIAAAIQAAVNAIVNNKLLKGAGKGKTLYPHRNKPDSAKSSQDKWSDYNLPECAQAPDPGFIEFPILRDHSVYTGGEGGPDRVLFQFVTDGNKDVTYPAKGMNGLVGNFRKLDPRPQHRALATLRTGSLMQCPE